MGYGDDEDDELEEAMALLDDAAQDVADDDAGAENISPEHCTITLELLVAMVVTLVVTLVVVMAMGTGRRSAGTWMPPPACGTCSFLPFWRICGPPTCHSNRRTV